ncbi:hypothetical protein TWF481_008200 [Arthrobotrys musiformis]|uniref:Uncharacterized protein n=1 Tax=Arthrobotrys musiformis TaxID=47236 RepID=A0AAV9W8F9_9PEZI
MLPLDKRNGTGSTTHLIPVGFVSGKSASTGYQPPIAQTDKIEKEEQTSTTFCENTVPISQSASTHGAVLHHITGNAYAPRNDSTPEKIWSK